MQQPCVMLVAAAYCLRGIMKWNDLPGETYDYGCP